MKEIDELGSGIEKLKKTSQSQKQIIENLEKDRIFLMDRVRFLGQKLSEAYAIYEEAGKRILDFVDKEIGPIKGNLSELSQEIKRLSALEGELKAHSSYIQKSHAMEEEIKKRLLENEKALRAANAALSVLKGHVERLGEREAGEDKEIEKGLSELKAHFESRLKGSEDRIGLKITEAAEDVLQDAMDSLNALAAAQDDLRKRFTDTSLYVRQLRTGMASVKKQLQNSRVSGGVLEKRVSDQQTLLKEIESSIGKITRRLDGISLEDDKLEKRLGELRRASETHINSGLEELRARLDSERKKQAEILESRLRTIQADFVSGFGKLSESSESHRIRLEKEIKEARKHSNLSDSALSSKISERALALENFIREQGRKEEKARNEIGKQISGQQDSIRGLDLAVGKITRRMDGISLEDEKLEKRLASVRKHAEDFAGLQASRLDSKLSSVSDDLKGRVVSLHKQLGIESEKLEKGLSELKRHAEEFARERTEKIDQKFTASQQALSERVSGAEGRLRSHIDLVQKKQLDSLNSKLSSFSDEFGARVSRIDERVSAERARANRDLELAAARIGKRLDGIKLEDDKLEKRLAGLRSGLEGMVGEKSENLKSLIESEKKRQAEFLESRLGSVSDDFAGKIASIHKRIDGIKLEDDKLEKRLSELRKQSEDFTRERESRLKMLIDSGREKQEGLLDSKLGSFSEDFSGRVAALSERMDRLGIEDDKLEKRLLELRKASEDFLREKANRLKSQLDEDRKKQAEFLNSRIRSLSGDIETRASQLSESILAERNRSSKELESALAKISKRLDGIKLEDDKLEKRLAGLRSGLEGMVGEKSENLKSLIESEKKRQAEALESKIKSLSGNFEGRMVSLHKRIDESISVERERAAGELESAAARIGKRLDGIKLEDDKLEKRLEQLRKQSEDFTRERESRLKMLIDSGREKQEGLLDSKLGSFSEDFSGRVAALSERMDRLGIEDDKLEKRLLELRKASEDFLREKANRLKSQLDEDRKKQAEFLNSRIRSLSGDIETRIAKTNEKILAEKMRTDTELEKIGKKLGGLGLEEEKLEKRLEQLRKHSEAVAEERSGKVRSLMEIGQKRQEELLDSRIEQLKLAFDSGQKRQEGILEARIKSASDELTGKIATMHKRLDGLGIEDEKLEKRLAEISKQAEDFAREKVVQLKSQMDSGQKKQLEILNSKIASLSDEIEKRVSRAHEKILSEGNLMEEIESRLGKKISDSQKAFDSKLAGLKEHSDSRIADVYSHVASERKALASARAALEKEIGVEHKILSERIGAASEKLEKRLAELSHAVSLERKALASEKAELSRSFEDRVEDAKSGLSESMKEMSGKVNVLEREASVFLQRIKREADAIEKDRLLSRGMSERIGKLESRLSSEMKGSLERVTSLEKGLRNFSLEISGLSKQLKEVGTLKKSDEKRAIELETRLKNLSSTILHLQSESDKVLSDLKKHAGIFVSKEDFSAGMGKIREFSESAIAKEQARNFQILKGEIERVSAASQKSIREMEEGLRGLAKRIGKEAAEEMKLDKRLAEIREEFKQASGQESQSFLDRISEISATQENSGKRMGEIEAALVELSQKTTDSHSSLLGQIKELKQKLLEEDGSISKAKAKEAELKEYLIEYAKSFDKTKGTEAAKMRTEMAKLKEEIAVWKSEQERLYGLLKEE